jgi:hypothetical protein
MAISPPSLSFHLACSGALFAQLEKVNGENLVPLALNPQLPNTCIVCCAGVAKEDFIKPRFADFSLRKKKNPWIFYKCIGAISNKY